MHVFLTISLKRCIINTMIKESTSGQIENEKLRVVVFDRFYGLSTDRLVNDPEGSGRAGLIDREKHDVVAYARTMGRAAMVLSAMAAGEIKADVVFVGGTMEPGDKKNDTQFVEYPAEVTRYERVGLFKKKPVVSRETVKSPMLPIRDSEGRYTLPTVINNNSVEQLDQVRALYGDQELDPSIRPFISLNDGHAIAGTIRAIDATKDVPIITTSEDFVNHPESSLIDYKASESENDTMILEDIVADIKHKRTK